MDAAEFLTALFGDAASPEARIAVWTLPDKRTTWFDDPDEAARSVRLVGSNTNTNVYFGVGLYRPGITRGRGKAEDVVAITCLWADLDFGPHHKKTGLPPDEAACRKLLERLGLTPSFIVHSGHGLQPYWLLKEPVTAQEGAARLAQRWGQTIQAHARVLGYTVDSVWDLARVLRVPGTWNRKYEPTLVRCGKNTGFVYDAGNLEDVCVPEAYSPDNPEAVVTVEALAPTNGTPLRLIEQLRREPSFKAIWDRERKDLPSASEYDLALANVGVDAGLTDQQIADLIHARREAHGDDVGKCSRRKYLADTIGKARMRQAADNALAEIEAGIPAPDPAQPEDPHRATILKALTATLGIPIIRWQQHGQDRAEYTLTLNGGEQIRLKGAEQLSQHRFGQRIYDYTGRTLRPVKAGAWRKLLDHLGRVREFTRDEDEEPRNQAREWIELYLRPIKQLFTEADEALEFKGPLYRAGRLHVTGDGLLRAINETAVPRVSGREVASVLRAAGFTRTVVSPNNNARLKSLRYWRDDAGVATEVVGYWYEGDKTTDLEELPIRESSYE